MQLKGIMFVNRASQNVHQLSFNCADPPIGDRYGNDLLIMKFIKICCGQLYYPEVSNKPSKTSKYSLSTKTIVNLHGNILMSTAI